MKEKVILQKVYFLSLDRVLIIYLCKGIKENGLGYLC